MNGEEAIELNDFNIKMNYWHIQMFLPEGSGGTTINSIDMLKETPPVIGTGEWDNFQCRNFKGIEGGVSNGDIVLVREGQKVMALCKVLGDNFNDSILESKYININYRKVKVLEFYNGVEDWTQTRSTIQILTDKTTDSWKFVDSWYKKILNNEKMNLINNILKNKKQIIIQGAPGSGKTYKTAEIALGIIDKLPTDTGNRDEIMKAYRQAVNDGQIMFTTFHQSLDYEEFIEGLRPVTTAKGELTYEVQSGIFKEICEKALQNDNLKKLNEAIELFKIECSDGTKNISLKTTTGVKFSITYREGKTFRVRSERSQAAEGDDFPANIDYIRKLYIGDPKPLYNLSYVKGILAYLKETYKISDYKKAENDKNYVLIIDEINRGNISKIFGELITLLESDKRLGCQNEIKVRLTYSPEEEFGVPSNLYIIGTMNTADRSLGYIDYAVRRRFAFITLKSERNIIENYNNNEETKISALSVFDKITNLMKENIASDFSADDMMVGHSYFLAKDNEELQLKLDFEIIPLLKEYVKDGILSLSSDEVESKIDILSL